LTEAAKLTLGLSASGVVLSWPDTPGGWQLQASATLDAGWADVKAAPVPAEGRMTVTVDAHEGTRFFRLRGASGLALGAKRVAVGLMGTTVLSPATVQLQQTKRIYEGIHDGINW
jgi:hypothetical protein